ncbi:MAG: hypothetical protein EU529_01725 [Promethearchaeota archaeon]|nr:MAG: hypothetical protein EU529_01725 [Candidatus Lokiarchaeota archaeon]
MGDSHSKSFFGQNTGLVINSSSKSEPFFFIRCIKKKPGGSWEKPSAGEGKVIKCSLDEIVMILQVLNRKQLNWSCYHNYKNNKSSISFGWEDEQAETLWINIANYSKMLNFAQAEILRLLLVHILHEKIKYATCSNGENLNNKMESKFYSEGTDPNKNNLNNNITLEKNYDQNLFEQDFEENVNQDNQISSILVSKSKLFKEMTNINGAIKGETEKALLLTFKSGQEIWIPKSTIHCQYIPKKMFNQNFLIDNWILNRNKILT